MHDNELPAWLNDPGCLCWRLRVPKDSIGYLRFLLEAYEGLAQLVSEGGQEEVVLVIPKEQQKAALALIADLRAEMPIELLDPPPPLDGSDHP